MSDDDSEAPPRWERQPDETAVAFAAFTAYLQMGTGRSVTKVATECNKSRSLMGRWSSRHTWRVRALAWDAHVASEYRAEVIDARRTLAHRHLAVTREALAKVAAGVTAIEADDLTVPELTRLWDVASRIERDALQVPTRVAVTGTGSSPSERPPLDEMTDEERLARLIGLRRELDRRITERQEAIPCPDPTV